MQISFWHPLLGDQTKSYLDKVLDSGFLNDGPFTKQFEEKIAILCETQFAVATTSGTTALFLALKACDIGVGDEVLIPNLTFIATANAVSLTGAKPILVDIDPDTFTISTECVRKAITGKTKAIIPVHVTGRACAMVELLSIAKEHGLYVIEDAAEALGSKYHGKPLGSFGHFGCFSFSPNKTITTGQGGMVVTQDENSYRRLLELKDQGRPLRGTGGDDIHLSLGFNFKFTDLQAAVGLAQLDTMKDRLNHLRFVHHFYKESLASLSMLRLPVSKTGELLQWFDLRTEKRESLFQFLLTKGIQCRKYWHPLHTQTPYRKAEEFPVSDRISSEALWLPSALSLTEGNLQKVCENIHIWAKSV